MNLNAQQIYFDNGSGSPTTGNLYYQNDNLGIGDSDPQKGLTIVKVCEDPANPISSGIRLNSSFNDPITSTCKFSIWDFDNKDHLYFSYAVSPTSAFTTKMLLTNTGQLVLGSETPHESAILHVASDSKGALLPKMTTDQMNEIISPANGLIVYDIEENAFMYHDAGTWYRMFTESDFLSTPAGGITQQDTTNWNTAFRWGNCRLKLFNNCKF